MTERLLDLSVDELLQRVAARTPAPGGGGVAALTTALAAALVAMSARFAGQGADAARADTLRDEAADLADLDAAAYGAYLAALRRARTGDPDHGVDEARSAAVDVPVAIAERAAEVAVLAARLAQEGNPNLRGDAVTSGMLAAAAAAAAAALVAENLADTPDDPRVARAAALAEQARTAP